MGGVNHDNARCHTDWYVYRFYATNGRLLYVGKTCNTKTRTAQHAKTQPWWDEVCIELTRTESYATEAAALAEEKRAIRSEHPKYNKQHNDSFRVPEVIRAEITPASRPIDFYEIICIRHAAGGKKLKRVISELRWEYPANTAEIFAAEERYRERYQSRQPADPLAPAPLAQIHLRSINGHIGRGLSLSQAAAQVIAKTGDVIGVREACEFLLEDRQKLDQARARALEFLERVKSRGVVA